MTGVSLSDILFINGYDKSAFLSFTIFFLVTTCSIEAKNLSEAEQLFHFTALPALTTAKLLTRCLSLDYNQPIMILVIGNI